MGLHHPVHEGTVLMKTVRMTVAAIGALLLAQPIKAQEARDWDPLQAYITREALQDLLDRLQRSANSPAYSASLRERTRGQAELIRRRLDEGDFQVGDRILLVVEDQQVLSDTFTVTQGPRLTLPTVGDVPLTGVLRSELNPRISEYLGRLLREPIVHAGALIRIAVLGGVVQPGYYTVAGEALLTDAVMIAGGPTADAKIDEIRVEREDNRIWEGEPLRAAMASGRTLDQLNLRVGDRIFIPQRGPGLGGAEASVRTMTFLIAFPLSIIGLVQIF